MRIIDQDSVGHAGPACGDANRHGMESVKGETVTQRWPDGGGGDGANAFIIATMTER